MIPDVGYSQIAPTISALKNIPSSNRTTGYSLLVPEIQAWVVYLNNSTDTPNNTTVFAPNDGIGRWVVTNQITKDTLVYVGVAAETVSALRGVTLDINGSIVTANPSTASLLGLSITAANPGNSVSVVLSGTVSDNSWSWEIDKSLFISNDGIITQTTPTSPKLLILGRAVNPSTVNVQKEIYRIL
jgi:hypothetical protein